MPFKYIPGESRGGGDYGWLKTKYSFSFANYYEPSRMGFGALRVINDDWIAPNSGFGTHEHENMEIITIPLVGTLTHKDSLGTEATIKAGEVQVMSAGTGIAHSEYNASVTEALELFQIWIEPKSYGIAPRYDQKRFNFEENQDVLLPIITPKGIEGTLFIHQEASLYLGYFTKASTEEYSITDGHGVYLLVVEGEVSVGDQKLSKRDALSVTNENKIEIVIQGGSRLLFIDVPL